MPWAISAVSMVNKNGDQVSSLSDYVAKHRAMSSTTAVVDLFWRDKKQFAFTVNPQVFNPHGSYAAYKLIDLVLSEEIAVADRAVVDLGCGSGVIGLCAILKKAKKVLFTDVNPHIDGIQHHPFFRRFDEVMVQDLMSDLPGSSYDTILVIPPAQIMSEGRPIASDTFESGVFRSSDMYPRIIAEAGRVLTPGGQLVMWLRIPLAGFDSFVHLLSTGAQYFDLSSMTLLAYGVESLICLEHEQSRLNRWFYKFQKGGVERDAVWMMLSVKKCKA